MSVENEQPAFVVTDMATGHKYEIFASGQTRGFEGLARGVVFNRIPGLIAEAVEKALSGADEPFTGNPEDFCGITPEMRGVR